MGLLVGHGSLLLNLRSNARDSRLYPKGLKRGGFLVIRSYIEGCSLKQPAYVVLYDVMYAKHNFDTTVWDIDND